MFESLIKEIGKEELEKLIEVTGKLLSTIDYDKLLEIIFESAKVLTNSEASSLLLMDEKVNKLKFAVATGEAKDKLLSLYVPLDEESIAGYVAKEKKPVIVNDVRKFPKWYSKIDEITKFKTRSILAVPLILEGNIIGVIEVLNKKGFEGYAEDDLKLLQILAEQAAKVLKNASLYKSLVDKEKLREDIESLKYTIVGKNPVLQKVIELAKKVAKTDTTVLMFGESGTGKELLARYIHNHSERKHNPFIIVNCAAIPSTLIESELFGYEKGAFTGALQRKLGKFELAHKGTIFLDEIGDLTLDTQVKILRFLEEKEFERLGGKETIRVDVRIIAATNQNLERLIKEKKFREDLYYRINVFPIELPPLRERKEDIPLLVEHFIRLFNYETTKGIEGIEEDALGVLINYDWPGNIRELRNVIERAFVLASGKKIKKENILISKPLKFDEEELIKQPKEWTEAIHGFKRKYLEYILKRTGGNHKRAAEILGIQPSYLSRLKKELGFDEE